MAPSSASDASSTGSTLPSVPAATAHVPSRFYRASKRVIDLVAATITLCLVSPLLLIIALCILLTSRGPVIVRQVRVGRHRKPFVMNKFRTMYRDVDDTIHREYVTAMLQGETLAPAKEGGLYKLVEDPRVTSIGRFLRRSSLDELPQLFNVILGQMSLVGPRPMFPWEADLLREDDEIRFAVLPGLTGLWQVSGRSKLSMPQALELDREYVRRRCLRLDVSILFKTVPAALTTRGAG